MKTTFAAASLVAYTTAIKDKLKVEMNSYYDPMDILTQTGAEVDLQTQRGKLEITKRGDDRANVFNRFYGAYYHLEDDTYYDCVRSELYEHQTGMFRYWVNMSDDGSYARHWIAKSEKNPSRMDSSIMTYNSDFREFEFYDPNYGERSNTDGTMVTQRKNKGEKREVSVYMGAIEAQIYLDSSSDWEDDWVDFDEKLEQMGMRFDSSDVSDFEDRVGKSDELKKYCDKRREKLTALTSK